MGTLALFLGACEFILVPVSVVWLLWATIIPTRARVRRALRFAVVIAATVAQPFGIVAAQEPGPPRDAHPVSPTGIHIDRIAGILPILPFSLYRENTIIHNDTGSARATLKARSWFWLPVLTNGTAIKSICSDLTQPCWDPSTPDRSSLQLSEAHGRYYVTLLDPLGPRFGAPGSYTWELVPGIASIPGLIYWLLLGLAIPLLNTRLRARNGRPDDALTHGQDPSTSRAPPRAHPPRNLAASARAGCVPLLRLGSEDLVQSGEGVLTPPAGRISVWPAQPNGDKH